MCECVWNWSLTQIDLVWGKRCYEECLDWRGAKGRGRGHTENVCCMWWPGHIARMGGYQYSANRNGRHNLVGAGVRKDNIKEESTFRGEKVLDIWRWGHCDPPKRRELLTRHSLTHQKPWILWNSAVRKTVFKFLMRKCGVTVEMCLFGQRNWPVASRVNELHVIQDTPTQSW